MRANVEDRGMKGDCTPLMEAASAGHTDIVKLLISHCADVNAQSSSGEISQGGSFFLCHFLPFSNGDQIRIHGILTKKEGSVQITSSLRYLVM